MSNSLHRKESITTADFIAPIQTISLLVTLEPFLNTLIATFAKELPRIARVASFFRCLETKNLNKRNKNRQKKQLRQLSSSELSAQSNSPSQNHSFCLQTPS
jgi:hypothetical protein